MITVIEDSEKPLTISARELGDMSKEDRKSWLDDAPIGSKVTGLLYLGSGNEVRVSKEGGYSTLYSGLGAGSKLYDEYWSVAGYKDPTFARTIRTACDGSNKYYTVE